MTVKAVHRDLDVDRAPSGPDVAALQGAVNRRLDARGQESYMVKADGQFGRQTARACARAVDLLGAQQATVRAAQPGHGGRLTIGAQRMIRYPGRRSEHQLARARDRMDDVLHQKSVKIHEDAARHHSVDDATRAMDLLLKHAPSVHYTQGALRWQGISRHLLAKDGHFPNYADCSSAFEWAWWNAIGDGPDLLSGSLWRAGFTGTLLVHGRRVSRPIEGAAVIYGSGWPGKHVAYCLDAHWAISHGSEAAPFHVPIDYRKDIMQFRVYT